MIGTANIFRAQVPSPEILERSASDALEMQVTFARFNRWQLIDNPREGRFLERIAPTAFVKTVRESLRSIKAVLAHGSDASLGDQILGEVQAIDFTPDAATARVSLFPSVPPLLVDGLRSGVYGASFRGRPVKSKATWHPGRSSHNPEGLPEIVRSEIALRDIGPCAFPAYDDTIAKLGTAVVGEEAVTATRSAEPYWLLQRDYEPPWMLNRKRK